MVARLLTAGDQVPVNPSFEVAGRVKEEPLHIAGIALKVGVTGAPTFTVIVPVFEHCPAFGVNV